MSSEQEGHGSQRRLPELGILYAMRSRHWQTIRRRKIETLDVFVLKHVSDYLGWSTPGPWTGVVCFRMSAYTSNIIVVLWEQRLL